MQILSPGYLDVEAIEGAEILSTYENVLPVRTAAGAPVESTISESLFYQSSESRMILTGSHPEIDSTAIRSNTFKTAFGATNQQQSDIALNMEASDADRANILKDYFARIGLT